jgi:hypothetical protein
MYTWNHKVNRQNNLQLRWLSALAFTDGTPRKNAAASVETHAVITNGEYPYHKQLMLAWLQLHLMKEQLIQN